MVTGIARVKDEVDIIARVVTHMLDQVDRVLVADNASTDGTRDLLADLAREHPELTVQDDAEVGYFQSRQMSLLAVEAGQQGAAWVVPFDADEWWYSPHGRIADVLAGAGDASVAPAELYDHVATGVDPDTPDPVARIGWRRSQPAPLAKVACRPYSRVTIHQGNHDASYGARHTGLLVVRHFPYRSVDQFVSKVRNGAAAYAATDLPEHEGKHWRDYGQLLETGGPEAIGDVFRAWFWIADPRSDSTLVFDPAP